MAEQNNLIIIDPNTAFSKIPGGTVSPEDLSINVQLKTIRHDRTAIVAQSNGSTNITTLNGGGAVDFMAGNKIYSNTDNTSLTTYFTEIGSGFGDIKNLNDTTSIAGDLETLGITNITIDFNASGVPIIVMNLTDVRGRLFQYGNQSPYRVLFEMPYPIFELTVKGFYGQGVTYKLHLTKFNSKFNSDNASFEIRCEFIGYSYAYLSDLLIGYLKGVPYTTFGSAKIKNLSDGFISFTELNNVALETRKLVNKIKSEAPTQAIKAGQEQIESLEELKLSVGNLVATEFSGSKTNESKIGVIYVAGDLSSDRIKEICENEIKLLNEQIKTVNELYDPNNYTVSIIDFDKIFYRDLSIIIDDNGNNILNTNGREIDNETQEGIRSMMYEIGEKEISICVLDLSKAHKEIGLLIGNINTDSTNLTKELATSLGDRLNELPIKPTIGNYFKILCDHSDILFEAIRNVAQNAERNQISRKESFKAILSNLEKPNDSEDIKIKAFPNYTVKNNKTGALEERWIGNVAPNIPEVNFVNELINGIISSARADKDAIADLATLESLEQGKDVAKWFPVHVFDSMLFSKNNVNPYEILKETNDVLDFIRLVIFRAFTFINYNNHGKSLTESEIQNMAWLEANNAVAGIDEQLQNLIINSSQDLAGFINQNATKDLPNDSNTNPIMTPSQAGGELYEYGKYNTGFTNYPINNIIPFRVNNFKDLNLQYLVGDDIFDSNRIELRNNNNIFLGSARPNNNLGYDNGSTYLKILNTDPNKFIVPTYDVITTSSGIFDINDVKRNEFFNYSNGLVSFDSDSSGFSSVRFFYSDEDTFIDGIFKDKTNFKKSVFDLDGTTIVPFSSKNKPDDPLEKRRIENTTRESVLTPNHYVNDFMYQDTDGKRVSLFSSKLYRRQTNDRAKALLFLATIPFDKIGGGDWLSLFNQKSGLVKVPALWVYYIGGLLAKETSEFINYGNPLNNKFVSGNYIPPTKNESLKLKDGPNVLGFSDGPSVLSTNNSDYSLISDSIIGKLPIQVQIEFITAFEDWVTSDTGFQDIKAELEVFRVANDEVRIQNLFNNLKAAHNMNGDLDYTFSGDDLSILSDRFLTNYIHLGPIDSGDYVAENIYNFLHDLNPDGQGSKKLTTLLNSYLTIANGSPAIWVEASSISENNIFSTTGVMQKYLGYFVTKFNSLKKEKKAEDKKESEELQQDLFQTLNGEDMRLKIYKDIKAIYDKWICGNNRLPKLYDEFKFINRSYKDISQDFKVNIPRMVEDLLENYNQPIISHLSKMLTDNNFNFFPMPNYLDLTNPETFNLLFQAFPWENINKTDRPLFVCMYTGELSNTLDFGDNGNFTNDGITLIKNRDAQYITNAEDFNTLTDDNERIPIMLVRYGDQNQGIFKTLNLDQSEFTVSNESLTIVDDLSKGASTGQNLYDYYQNRSYSVEIEMMGNAMIQPFLYLSLENVPMFRGLYTIFKVNHVITPNNMVTKIKAYRVKDTMTKMVDDETLFNAFFNDFNDITTTSTSLGGLKSSSSDVPDNEVVAEIPLTATGIQSQPGKIARFAVKEVKDFILDLGMKWNSFAISNNNGSNSKYNDILYYNDASLPNGGDIKGHSSHEHGLSWDVRQIAFKKSNGDNFTGPLVLSSREYTQNGTREFIQMIINLAKSPKYLLSDGRSFIKNIYFNDKVLKGEFSSVIKEVEGHHTHLHLEFNVPDRITKNNKENNLNTDVPMDNVGGKGSLSDAKYPAKRDNVTRASGTGKITTPGLKRVEKAFLDVIAYAEGTSNVSQNGYDVALGDYLIVGYTKDTLDIPHGNKNWLKESKSSSAAGRYQFVGTTWSNLKGGNKAFSSTNQDIRAKDLVRSQTGSLNIDNIINPDKPNGFDKEYFYNIIEKLKPTWTSFKNLNGLNPKSDLFNIFVSAYNSYS